MSKLCIDFCMLTLGAKRSFRLGKNLSGSTDAHKKSSKIWMVFFDPLDYRSSPTNFGYAKMNYFYKLKGKVLC